MTRGDHPAGRPVADRHRHFSARIDLHQGGSGNGCALASWNRHLGRDSGGRSGIALVVGAEMANAIRDGSRPKGSRRHRGQFPQDHWPGARGLEASRALLISQQVSKGFEDLGNKDAIMARLGGIYGLEGVMNTSEQYYQPVLEALCAFVRDGTIGIIVNDTAPVTDIQAALTVIGRRTDGSGGVDLANANIPRANLRRAKLRSADLSDANLSGANLSGANLNNVNLSGAHLDGANLNIASLSNANLKVADLRGANLLGAILAGANLSGANLNNANLGVTYLVGANLSGANLSGVNLVAAYLDSTKLNTADLSGARLDGQTQLDQACGTDAKLPPDLTLKPCPTPP
jgi:hypothetical protein